MKVREYDRVFDKWGRKKKVLRKIVGEENHNFLYSLIASLEKFQKSSVRKSLI